MRDGEDSGEPKSTTTTRQEMEEMLAHYQSYFIRPGDEDLPNYKPQKIQSAEEITARIVVLANLEFASIPTTRNCGDP